MSFLQAPSFLACMHLVLFSLRLPSVVMDSDKQRLQPLLDGAARLPSIKTHPKKLFIWLMMVEPCDAMTTGQGEGRETNSIFRGGGKCRS